MTWNDLNSSTADLNKSFNDHVKVVSTTTGRTLVDTDVPYDATRPGAVIAAGTASAQRQYAFTLPDGDPGVGRLQITVTTDYDNIFQAPASGHSATIATASTLANYPDLQVANLAMVPANAAAGFSRAQRST